MKERPILFSAPMVRAILDGRKTQTRRVVKNIPADATHIKDQGHGDGFLWMMRQPEEGVSIPLSRGFYSPYGQPGDQLWVRETWRVDGLDRQGALRNGKDVCGEDGPSFFADCECDPALVDGPWIPSIHMPRWASRIQLEITGVRVERLNDISDFDAFAEGAKSDVGTITGQYCQSYIQGYKILWESINGPGSWDANPWVWVVEFRRLQK